MIEIFEHIADIVKHRIFISDEMLELAAGKSTQHANLIAWYERIGQREDVQRGLLIPEANPPEMQMEIFVNAAG